MKEKMIFFTKNVSRPSNLPDQLAQNVSKKIPLERIVPPFFSESSESDRVINYLHDSNSIFRVGGINSEWVFRCTACKNADVLKIHEVTNLKKLTTVASIFQAQFFEYN